MLYSRTVYIFFINHNVIVYVMFICQKSLVVTYQTSSESKTQGHHSLPANMKPPLTMPHKDGRR